MANTTLTRKITPAAMLGLAGVLTVGMVSSNSESIRVLNPKPGMYATKREEKDSDKVIEEMRRYVEQMLFREQVPENKPPYQSHSPRAHMTRRQLYANQDHRQERIAARRSN